jgi:hypothetical protein
MPKTGRIPTGTPFNSWRAQSSEQRSGSTGVPFDPVAHIHVSLGTNPVSLGWGDPEQDPDRVFLSVEASRISVIYLRQAFDLLGKADKRLPATF